MSSEVKIRILKPEEWQLIKPILNTPGAVRTFLETGEEPSIKGEMIIIGVFYEQQLLGALVSLLQLWQQWCVIKEMALRSDVRNIGIEQAIFNLLERHLRGHKEIKEMVYIHDDFEPISPDWQALLYSVDFSEPENVAWIGSCNFADIGRPLFENKVQFAPPFHVKKVSEMTSNEFTDFMIEATKLPWFSSRFRPFTHIEHLAKEGSIALFKDKEICGWLTCHFGAKGCVEFSNVVVAPGFEDFSLAGLLINYSVQSLMQTSYWDQLHCGRFFVVYSPLLVKWKRSLKRHFKSLLEEDYERKLYRRPIR